MYKFLISLAEHGISVIQAWATHSVSIQSCHSLAVVNHTHLACPLVLPFADTCLLSLSALYFAISFSTL